MKAKGVSRDQAQDRNNYAAGSVVMERIYDYDGSGLGLIKGLSSTYLKVRHAVDKMLGDLHDQKLGFILPKKLARGKITHHLMTSSWTTKSGNKCGRNIGDMTYVDETKAAAEARWGMIRHPTINGMALIILDFWKKVMELDPSADWSHLRVFKMDLKGAYTLIDVLSEDVGCFAQELDGERAAQYLISVDELHYAKCLDSFQSRPSRYIVETDGSLKEVGIITYEVSDCGETCVGCCAVSIEQFGFGTDLKYQNRVY